MKVKKIEQKFFLILFGLILFIFLIQNILQLFFLEPYYENQKYITMKKEVEKISTEILNSKTDIQTKEKLNDFYIKTGNVIAIFNQYGWVETSVINSFSEPIVRLRGKDGKITTVNIQGFYNDKRFQEALLKNKEISIEGIATSDILNNILPEKIKINDITFESNTIKIATVQTASIAEFNEINTKENKSVYIKEDKSVGLGKSLENEDAVFLAKTIKVERKKIEGFILDYSFPSKETIIQNYEYNELLSEAYGFLYKQINNKKLQDTKVYSYEKTDLNTGLSHQFMFMPLKIKNEIKYIGISYKKESIKDSVIIAQKFNSWLVGLSLIIVFVIAKILSRMITKPLVEMEHVTQKMANLDFSEVVTIYENNEIGSLANHINRLSSELEKNILDLEMRKNILEENLAYKEELDTQRKMFMASVSHDFKTPLTIIQGICEGIENGIYDINKSEEVEKIKFQLKILNNMVDNLLTISKFDQGIYKKQETVWQLNDLVYEVYAELKEMSKHRNILVKFDLEDCFVSQDEQKLKIVIRNLLSNSIQYAKEGSEIEVSIFINKEIAKLVIVNEGHIEEEDISKLYEAFYRPDKSRNQNSGGSGLGLYLVKQILELCNLNLNIISKDNLVKVWIDFEIFSKEKED